MPDMGAGTLLFKYDFAVATLSLSPQVPASALVRRILLGNQSATDTWVIRCNGQEVGRYLHSTAGTYNALAPVANTPVNLPDIFTYCKDVLGFDLVYPVPEGKTITISSEGGATADIAFVYEEFAASALNPSIVNYPGGNYYVCPRWFYLAAHPTAAGEHHFDTEVGLDFAPNLFIQESFPVGWTARIWDLFFLPLGVNAYASSTNHKSTTKYIAALKSGQRLFTRASTDGIPLEGTPSADGSANNTTSIYFQGVSPFYDVAGATDPNIPQPIDYRPGYVYDWRLATVGDHGAGADYSPAKQLAIVEYRSA